MQHITRGRGNTHLKSGELPHGVSHGIIHAFGHGTSHWVGHGDGHGVSQLVHLVKWLLVEVHNNQLPIQKFNYEANSLSLLSQLGPAQPQQVLLI